MNSSRLMGAALAALLALGGGAASAAPANPNDQGFTVYRSAPAKAGQLLDRAIDYLNENPGERAFAAFNNQRGGFYENDLYVFVVGLKDGIMHANGGAPEGIVGSPVLDLQDAAGKKFIREMVDTVNRQGSGSVDYLWLNRTTNRVEHKTSLISRAGDYLVGVGFYTR